LPVAFAPISGNKQGPALRDRTGTISREAAMLFFAAKPPVCVTGGTTCASDLLERIWATWAKSEVMDRCALVRWRPGCHPAL